jgi:subtilisin family serine protease
VLCVGATDQNDAVPGFVTTGPEMAICAPGVDILTTQDTIANPDGFATETGTSLACPFVAGAAALVWSVNPELTSQQVRYILIATADDVGTPGWDQQSGWGRLNAERAVQLADPNPRPACDVDWNGDGTVNSPDFFSFLDDYLRLDADFNGDGITDSADFFQFISAFFAGC